MGPRPGSLGASYSLLGLPKVFWCLVLGLPQALCKLVTDVKELLLYGEFHNPEFKNWHLDTLTVRDELGITPGYTPFAKRFPAGSLKGLPRTRRVLDLLNMAEAWRLKERLSKTNFYVNVTQSVKRRPWGRMKTFTGHVGLFDFQREQTVSVLEMFAIMGYPAIELAQKVSHVKLKAFQELVGNSMSLPCVGTVLMAFFLNSHGVWWRREISSRSVRRRHD